MSHRCLADEELDEARALPPGDPRRLELESCPRCRSLLDAYAEFLENGPAPPGIDAERAAAPLRDAFERALGPEPMPRRVQAGRAWSVTRVAWAAAASLAVVAGGLVGLDAYFGAHRDDALRAGPVEGAGPALRAPRAVAGGLELGWTAVSGADTYRVVFLDERLQPVADTAPTADTSFVLSASRLPAGLAPGATVAWRVEALQGGYVIETSASAIVHLPRVAPGGDR